MFLQGPQAMTIEAPLSRYKKQNLIIVIAALFGFGIWFYYDSHYDKNFIEKHTVVDEQGQKQPNSTLLFNQKAPPFMFVLGAGVAVYFFAVRNKKVIADDTGLTVGGKTIAYNAIEKIDKTFFDRKGFFVITYKDSQGQSRELKLSDRTYDNLATVLDHLVAKIS
jgi:hypothetical protein